jgi:hypothetical protein
VRWHAAALNAALTGVGELGIALLGPLFYRRWFSREPIDDRFIKTVTRGAIATDSLTP